MRILRNRKIRKFVLSPTNAKAVRFLQLASFVGGVTGSACEQDLKNCNERSARMKQSNELTPRQAAEVRLNYPPGTRVMLDHMDDKYAVPDGTRGTVDHVDDAGHYG